MSYKYWHGGWIDVRGTNGMGIHGTCSEGKPAEYTTAEKCNTSIRRGGEGTLGPAPGS